MQQAEQVTTFDMGDLYPQHAALKGVSIEGLAQPGIYTPDIDPDYVHRLELLRDMYGFWVSEEVAMLIIGHSGCGKTSFVEQWHAKLNLPLMVVCAHPRMDISDLIGHYVPTENGGMKFHYGPVALAAIHGYSVLVDEYFVLDPGVATGLNTLLQGGMLIIPETGEVIRPKRGFRMFMATNPADVGAGYTGRNTQDAANLDRCYTIQVPYPTPQEEEPLVAKTLLAGGLEESNAKVYAERMVAVANSVRKLYCGTSNAKNALEITLSTRSLKRWASLFLLFSNKEDGLLYALDRAVTNRASPTTAKAIQDFVKTEFGLV